jgi:PAS domain-containing protein
MINTSHPGTTQHDTETASDLDSDAGQAGTIGDWAACLANLLEVAFREVNMDRERANASIAKASLLLRIQIERSSFDPTHNRVHLEQDMDIRGQVEEALRANEGRWRTVLENTSVGVALTNSQRSPGMAKGFTLCMLRAVISDRGDEVVSVAKTFLWR